MESWDGYNYYTSDPQGWVTLMNLSTQEFGIAYFPSNLIAIPGSLNDSYSFIPNNTIVIENAAKTEDGSRDIEKIIFGVTSGIAILWGIWWLVWTWHRDGLPHPRKSPGKSGSNGNTNSDLELANLAINPNFRSAATFRDMLRRFYYENVQTGLEMVEKDVAYDGVDAEDVEEVIALVQKMYAVDLELWSLQSVQSTTEERRNQLRRKSNAILDEIRRIVQSWEAAQNVGRWEEDEVQHVHAISRVLTEIIGETRYTL
jgi:hypothetical protein